MCGRVLGKEKIRCKSNGNATHDLVTNKKVIEVCPGIYIQTTTNPRTARDQVSSKQVGPSSILSAFENHQDAILDHVKDCVVSNRTTKFDTWEMSSSALTATESFDLMAKARLYQSLSTKYEICVFSRVQCVCYCTFIFNI